MRGIFNYVRSFSNEVREFGWSGAFENLRADWRDAVRCHFGNHLGGSISGVFVRIPFTRFSAFIEHTPVAVGFDVERSEGTIEIRAGRVQVLLCVEPKAAW